MKIQFNPIIEKLSGKLKNLIFISHREDLKNMKPYIRSKAKPRAKLSIRQINSNRAFQILNQKYRDLKANPIAFSTWQKEAQRLKKLEHKVWTAHKLFISYFMKQYTQTIGLQTKPINLSSGTSPSYNDRSTRTWNSISTYGTGSFGSGTYGN